MTCERSLNKITIFTNFGKLNILKLCDEIVTLYSLKLLQKIVLRNFLENQLYGTKLSHGRL